MKILLLLFLTLLLTNNINSQEDSLSIEIDSSKRWVAKARLFPAPGGHIIGVGLEKQISNKKSIVILYNNIVHGSGNSAPVNKTFSLNPELRNYFGKFSNSSYFLSTFLEIGKNSKSIGQVVDIGNSTHRKGGNFLGIGLLLGKNIRFYKHTHLDVYLGPKLRYTRHVTLERVDNKTTQINENLLNLRVRFGINFNIIFI